MGEGLYRRMYAEGIRAIPQYSIDKYELDFALFDGIEDWMLRLMVSDTIEIGMVNYVVETRSEITECLN